ncbi:MULTISPECIES: prepilin-type N-terminal cleavage/methylation domain-containing protein [Methylococcus]|uniref:Prepilin-type N-terminal cleavage/methylation domain-containing protein n=1 Tax=Methylococcus capsulatus TaxID=414 RepID=A0ABZ2F3X8_METCP|nr:MULTISPECIES: prepilin-type N-terminal cleavage/methylation domain-containing protein [Methylococcus]MDF9392817.1 prepilin-type N-terminal cleavage/methylation domain-containing protein [Methylococcus capsulatus]UQN13184.1 prepilin-type N-terminal cleavage/methylation domain-containing protein [Methylococcus capsulatus]
MDSRGFTLIEVLIATSLLAVMSLILTASLRLAAASWEKGEVSVERASRALVVQEFLRARLAMALPIREPGEANRMVLAFRGGPQTLSFVSTLPAYVRGGLHRFRLYLAQSEEGTDLRVSVMPLTNNPQDPVAPIDDVLVLEGVAQFRLSYLRQNELNGELVWVEEWQELVMPRMVRLVIQPEGEDPWPPLMVAPRLDVAR